jgi:hypothetical protein
VDYFKRYIETKPVENCKFLEPALRFSEKFMLRKMHEIEYIKLKELCFKYKIRIILNCNLGEVSVMHVNSVKILVLR